MLRFPDGHPASLRFLRSAVPRLHPVFAPSHPGYPSDRPGGVLLVARPPLRMPLLPWNRQDLPSSCETPMTRLHMLQRLRRNRLRLAITPRRRGPQSTNAEGFRNKSLSKLNRMAFGFAVYASQAGLPRRHARLASRRWLGSPGWAHSTGSLRRFQRLISFASSFPGCLARWRFNSLPLGLRAKPAPSSRRLCERFLLIGCGPRPRYASVGFRWRAGGIKPTPGAVGRNICDHIRLCRSL